MTETNDTPTPKKANPNAGLIRVLEDVLDHMVNVESKSTADDAIVIRLAVEVEKLR